MFHFIYDTDFNKKEKLRKHLIHLICYDIVSLDTFSKDLLLV